MRVSLLRSNEIKLEKYRIIEYLESFEKIAVMKFAKGEDSPV